MRFLDLAKLMQIQSELNDFTLKEKKVKIPHSTNPAVLPTLVQASSGLKAREGELVRHHSGLVRMLDMYQWAGNREFLELKECYIARKMSFRTRYKTIHYKILQLDFENARMEIVDIMHFDLSLLALTCTEPKEVEQIKAPSNIEIDHLEKARMLLDNLQLTKWWTTNQVSIKDIRNCAIKQFAMLLHLAIQGKILYKNSSKSLFKDYKDIEQTYLKKVQVNYDRIRSNYDHLKK